MKKEKFSVLIAVYKKDNAKHLMEAIESCFNQTLIPDEIILVKDGELTLELNFTILNLQKKYIQFKVVGLKKNRGLGLALKYGLKFISCDIVARMDSDDISKPNRFEKQIRFLERNPEIGIVGSWISEFNIDPKVIICERKVPENHLEISKTLKYRNPFNHPSVVFRKKAVLKAGSYKHFPLNEDYYLWGRMLINNIKFYNIQESLLSFRINNETYSRRGGIEYIKHEINLQNKFEDLGIISKKQKYKNLMIRVSLRIIPNFIRKTIYIKIIREIT